MNIYYFSKKMDRIDQLTGTRTPTNLDIEAMKQLFRANEKKSTSGKDVLLPTLLFVLLSLPIVDSAIRAKITDSNLLVLFSKALAFLLIYYIIRLIV